MAMRRMRSNVRHSWILAVKKFWRCGWALCFLGVAENGISAQTTNVVVHPEKVLVKNFEGWGTSLCWWANVCGGYTNRETYAELAFRSLKLNIVRYNIGGGENPNIPNTLAFRARVPGFEPADGVWDWNADANQRWMLKRAVALGADRVVAFANSPPWWMTESRSVTGTADGSSNNLRAECELAFCQYLATVVSNLTVLDGVRFDYVTPLNEPSANWWKLGHWQEGCHVSAGQQARLVNTLRTALDRQSLATRIIANEDNDERSAVSALESFGQAERHVALIATHTYHANDPSGIRNLAKRWSKPAWVSEYGDGDASGLTLARRIRDDITEARVSAWIYWQVVDNAGGWGFLRNPLSDEGDSMPALNKKYFVMGQFSRFIRPGAEIIAVDDANSLAAYDPIRHSLTIVALNDEDKSLKLCFDLSQFAGWPTQVSGVQTSAQQNWSVCLPNRLADQYYSVELQPRSVSSFSFKPIDPSK